MKILVVTPTCHFRQLGGVQEEVYAVVDLLKKLGHDVSFATLDSPPQGAEVLEMVRKRLGVPMLSVNPGTGTIGDWLKACLRDPAFFHRTAYLAERMTQRPEWDAFLKDVRPDVVLSFCSYTWPVLRDANRRGAKTVFRSHDFVPEFFWESLSAKEKRNPGNALRKWAMRIGERRAVQWADAIAPTPLREAQTVYERWKPGRSSVVTLAYLPPWIRPASFHAGKKPLDVFYIGANYNMSFHVRGVKTLIEEIAPRALAQAPNAFRFNIIGARLPADLKSKCDGTSIIYHDYVPDLQAFLDGMDIGVAPVDTGRSIKGKVFGPICRAFPMIIAPNCLSGYPLKDGENVMIAETPAQYVEALLALRDDTKRKRVSDGAAAFAQKHFSEKKLLADLQRAVDIATAAR